MKWNALKGMVIAAAGILFIWSISIQSTYALTLTDVQKYIEENNLSWTAGETSVSRLTEEEFHSLLGINPPVIVTTKPGTDRTDDAFRGSFDWRENGGVSPVKAQGNCGSCWAFCLVHMLESYVMIYDHYTPDLSEQQLVSCNSQGYGCDGGWLNAASYFVNPGMADESCMPYQASDVPCQAQSCTKIAIADDWDYTGDSINAIKSALQDGPVATTMYVYDDFRYYTGGCYSHGSAGSVNHGVLIVGYDDAACSGDGAWIVKNSWGTDWGDDGFFMIKYGDCNIGYASTRIYYTSSSRVDLSIAEVTVDDVVGGNGNGYIDPGEDVYLKVTLGNSGNITATDIGGVLQVIEGDGIRIMDNTASWPDIPMGTTAESEEPHFRVKIPDDFSVGEHITFGLSITCNEGYFTDQINTFCGNIVVLYWSGFEGSTDEEWTHQKLATQDDWQRGEPRGTSHWDPPSAFQGSKIWGNDLGPSGWDGNYKPDVHNRLYSCFIPTNGMTDIRLSFKRWLTVEKGSKDKARIYAAGIKVWENPEQENLIDTSWKNVEIDISDAVAGRDSFRIMFELISDSDGNYGGWNIDDFMVIGLPPEPTATPTPAITPTPTATPTPDPDDIQVSFIQTGSDIGAGERFAMAAWIVNEGPSVKGDFYCIVQLGDEFWFFPSWSFDPDYYPVYLEGADETYIKICDFIVPELSEPVGPFYLFGCVMRPNSFELMSNITGTSFMFL